MVTSLVSQAIQFYNETMEKADPRVLDYPFMDRPGLNLVGTLLYVFIVTYAGPKYMKNRPAYNLRKWMVIYNIIMVAFSAYIFYEFLAAGWLTGYSLVCQECDYSYSAKALRMVRACYLFWFTKYIEFLDTYNSPDENWTKTSLVLLLNNLFLWLPLYKFFFIAHKKFNHVSFLHVIHHSLMAFTWWYGVKFSPGGLGTFHGMINSFVHVVMYAYYAISAMGPAYQKYIWWKKYLTAFQMTQFIVVFGHMVNIIAFHDCKYPEIFKYVIASYGTLFFVFFANFWIQAYTKRAFRKEKIKQESNGYPSGDVTLSTTNPTVTNGVHKRTVANGDSKHD